jgi:hypothetical protein
VEDTADDYEYSISICKKSRANKNLIPNRKSSNENLPKISFKFLLLARIARNDEIDH